MSKTFSEAFSYTKDTLICRVGNFTERTLWASDGTQVYTCSDTKRKPGISHCDLNYVLVSGSKTPIPSV